MTVPGARIALLFLCYAAIAHAQNWMNQALGGSVSVGDDASCGGDSNTMMLPGNAAWSGEKTCLSVCPIWFNTSNLGATTQLINEPVRAGESNCHGLVPCSIVATVNTTAYETYTMQIKISRLTVGHLFTAAGCYLTLNNSNLQLYFPKTEQIQSSSAGDLTVGDLHHLSLQVTRGDNSISCNAFINSTLAYTGTEAYDDPQEGEHAVSVGFCPTCPTIDTVAVYITDAMMFDRLLTQRELKWLQTGDLPILQPASACLCSSTTPQANIVNTTDNWSLTCTTPEDATVSEGRLVSDEGALYLSDFLIDGMTDPLYDPTMNDYVPQFWASKPGKSDVSFTVHLNSVSKVNEVVITSLTPVPETAILLEALNMYETPSLVAQVAQASDCPNDAIPAGATCTVFSSSEIDDIYTTTISFTGDLPVVTSVKVTMVGLHTGSGQDGHKSHAITEVKVMGMPEAYFVRLTPTYGPEAGGTPLTVHGDNLDMYPSTISVGGDDCPLQLSDRKMLVCQTPGSMGSDLAVSVDYSGSSLSAGKFTYKTNPTISSMEPRITFARGGIKQTVTGTNLDSVAMPYLKTNVAYNNQTYPQANRVCSVSNGTHMFCPTPELTLDGVTDAVQAGNISYESGFILDGYTKYENLANELPNSANIQISPDPVIHEWNQTVLVFKVYNTETIEIMGEDLLSGCAETDYVVMIADEYCQSPVVEESKITCTPPAEQPPPTITSLNEQVPLVKVTVGDVVANIGYLKWHKSAWDDVSIRIAALCAIFAVALLILVICLIAFEKIRSRKAWGVFKHDLFNSIDPKMYARGRNILVNPSAISKNTTIRKGYYASMFVGTLKGRTSETKEDVLVKRLEWFDNMTTEAKMRMAKNELTRAINLHQVGHGNIHGALAIALSKSKGILAAYPFVDRADLKSYLRNPAVAIIVGDLVKMSSDIASAMTFLENQGIVHGDLAARNCMVDSQMTVYVSDNLGARAFYPKEYTNVKGFSRSISPRWMAPEYLCGEPVSIKSDVWSFGITFFEVLTRCQYPYEHLSLNDVIRFVLKGYQLNRLDQCPPELYSLMQYCWEFKPEERPEFAFIAEYLEGILSQLDMLPGGGGRSDGGANTPSVSRNYYEKQVPAPSLHYEKSVELLTGVGNKGFIPDTSVETTL